MVSLRCKLIVKDELEKLGLSYRTIELGEVDLASPVSDEQLEQLKAGLIDAGLELMDDRRGVLIERIKNTIDEMVRFLDEQPKTSFSEYISERLQVDYSYLSKLFSEVKNITIEQFIIAQKIERVKELLLQGELTLTEISYRLNYNSVAYLSYQFKKIVGMTPSQFKMLKHKT